MNKSNRQISRDESKLITRQRLLKTAAELLLENEPSSISMSDLTSGAGITQPAFYRHFTNKDECLREALESEILSIRNSIGLIRRNLANETSSYQSLEDLVRISYEAIASTGNGFKFVMREVRNPSLSSNTSAYSLRDEIINDIVADAPQIAAGLGLEYDTEYFRLVVDGLVGLGESFAVGYIDGKYEDLNTIVKITMQYLRATIPELLNALKEAENI